MYTEIHHLDLHENLVQVHKLFVVLKLISILSSYMLKRILQLKLWTFISNF